MGGPDADGAYHHVPLTQIQRGQLRAHGLTDAEIDADAERLAAAFATVEAVELEQLTELRAVGGAATVLELVDELAEQLKAFRELLDLAGTFDADQIAGELVVGISRRLATAVKP